MGAPLNLLYYPFQMRLSVQRVQPTEPIADTQELMPASAIPEDAALTPLFAGLNGASSQNNSVSYCIT
ncbi:unnamed protein product [Staurois parvus]|uniref:Uncharacterized protein n=1 Tax=Staurois parvus TaxID=386267 RepID=A0ABN9BY38_9NEOB|nr:unnamed protein product [Staurois parvus]